jgi:hypothetical protein
VTYSVFFRPLQVIKADSSAVVVEACFALLLVQKTLRSPANMKSYIEID